MEDVIDVISKGAAQSWQMENRYKTMIDDKFDFGFAVDWMRKDLKIAMDEAKKNFTITCYKNCRWTIMEKSKKCLVIDGILQA